MTTGDDATGQVPGRDAYYQEAVGPIRAGASTGWHGPTRQTPTLTTGPDPGGQLRDLAQLWRLRQAVFAANVGLPRGTQHGHLAHHPTQFRLRRQQFVTLDELAAEPAEPEQPADEAFGTSSCPGSAVLRSSGNWIQSTARSSSGACGNRGRRDRRNRRHIAWRRRNESSPYQAPAGAAVLQ